MLEFGLTGGIGSGKSTVSRLLADHGVHIIDADAIVHDLQRPGELVFDAMVAQWGSTIVREDGTLDRAAVASIVFSDAAELDKLNGIVHPAVADETSRRLEAIARDVEGGQAIVIHDIPLLVWPGGELLTSRDHTAWAGIVVVDTPEEVAVERVVAARGMDRDEVAARMAAQATREERRAVADFVIDNSGDLEALQAEVNRCWSWMTDLDGPSGVEGTESAHITTTGPDEPGGVEGTESAHITTTGPDEPGDVEKNG